MTDPITLAARIDELVAEHGSLRCAHKAVKLSPSYLSRLRSGEIDNPAPATLRKLGLARVVTYTRRTPHAR